MGPVRDDLGSGPIGNTVQQPFCGPLSKIWYGHLRTYGLVITNRPPRAGQPHEFDGGNSPYPRGIRLHGGNSLLRLEKVALQPRHMAPVCPRWGNLPLLYRLLLRGAPLTRGCTSV